MASLSNKVQLNPRTLKVPEGFKDIMEGYTHSVLKYQPKDIPRFSAQYFDASLNGTLETFLRQHEEFLQANMKTLQDYANMSPLDTKNEEDLGSYGEVRRIISSRRGYANEDDNEQDDLDILAMQVSN